VELFVSRAKCTVIIRAMNFICVLLEPTHGKVILKVRLVRFVLFKLRNCNKSILIKRCLYANEMCIVWKH